MHPKIELLRDPAHFGERVDSAGHDRASVCNHAKWQMASFQIFSDFNDEIIDADFEMLAPVELSIFCFRYLPVRLKRTLASANESRRQQVNDELDSLNERLLVELQRDGSSYLSNALIHGRFALRGCVMNYRTTLRDMETLLNDLRRVASRIEAGN